MLISSKMTSIPNLCIAKLPVKLFFMKHILSVIYENTTKHDNKYLMSHIVTLSEFPAVPKKINVHPEMFARFLNRSIIQCPLIFSISGRFQYISIDAILFKMCVQYLLYIRDFTIVACIQILHFTVPRQLLPGTVRHHNIELNLNALL